MAFSALDRYAEAAQAYVRALDINPAFVDARLNLGIVYREMGENVHAADSFRRVLDQEPDHPLAKQNLEEMQLLRAA